MSREFKRKNYHIFMSSPLLIFIAWFCIFLLGWYTIFVFILFYKIKRLEHKVEALFLSRTNLIPSIFEISKDSLIKHEEIFKEIILLRKQEFNAKDNSVGFSWFIQAETHLHHELNFVFKVCNQHQKLLRNSRFLYVRDLLIERSMSISEKMILYKSIMKKYNWYKKLHKFLLIWIFLSPKEITEI